MFGVPESLLAGRCWLEAIAGGTAIDTIRIVGKRSMRRIKNTCFGKSAWNQNFNLDICVNLIIVMSRRFK
jgi:hypothetical protein